MEEKRNEGMKEEAKEEKATQENGSQGKNSVGHEGVAYQNKDIVSKAASEYFKDKSLSAYGLSLPRIKNVEPTNLPAVEANELRLDCLLEFTDGSLGIIDYESEYRGTKQKLKYLGYISRVMSKRFKEGRIPEKIRMIIIYTGDIQRKTVSTAWDFGASSICIDPAFLSEVDGAEALRRAEEKIRTGQEMDEEEQMRFIIQALARKTKQEKQEALKEGIRLAMQIKDEALSTKLLAATLVFCDKIIDEDTAREARRWIEMTKIARIFEEEKREALKEKDREKEAALRKKDEEREAALQKKDEEKEAALRAEREKAAAERRTELYQFVSQGGMSPEFAANVAKVSVGEFLDRMRQEGYDLPQSVVA